MMLILCIVHWMGHKGSAMGPFCQIFFPLWSGFLKRAMLKQASLFSGCPVGKSGTNSAIKSDLEELYKLN